MKSYHLSLFVVGLLVVAPGYAQTVRFETSVGNFDVDLLPGYAPLNVENLLSYVTTGRYDNTVIHRAQDNFVVQMGAFSSATPEPPADTSGFSSIKTDPPLTRRTCTGNGTFHHGWHRGPGVVRYYCSDQTKMAAPVVSL